MRASREAATRKGFAAAGRALSGPASDEWRADRPLERPAEPPPVSDAVTGALQTFTNSSTPRLAVFSGKASLGREAVRGRALTPLPTCRTPLAPWRTGTSLHVGRLRAYIEQARVLRSPIRSQNRRQGFDGRPPSTRRPSFWTLTAAVIGTRPLRVSRNRRTVSLATGFRITADAPETVGGRMAGSLRPD